MDTFFETKARLDDSPTGYYDLFMQLRHDSDLYKQTAPAKAGSQKVNMPKNRYRDILPFDETRVVLDVDSSESDSDYINASYIKGVLRERTYIAAQAPLDNTVIDFWRLVWHAQSRIIVMACREFEMGKRKCSRYWPDEDDGEVTHGDITVTLLNEEKHECFMTRTLQATKGNKTLRLKQFHYQLWPDKDVPRCVQSILDLLCAVREEQGADSPPLIVHCSAGCGRTGTIIVIDFVRSLLQSSCGLGADFDLHELILKMRRQRPAMVQTSEQYRFAYSAVAQLIAESNDTYANVDAADQRNRPDLAINGYEYAEAASAETPSTKPTPADLYTEVILKPQPKNPTPSISLPKLPVKPHPTSNSDSKRHPQVSKAVSDPSPPPTPHKPLTIRSPSPSPSQPPQNLHPVPTPQTDLDDDEGPPVPTKTDLSRPLPPPLLALPHIKDVTPLTVDSPLSPGSPCEYQYVDEDRIKWEHQRLARAGELVDPNAPRPRPPQRNKKAPPSDRLYSEVGDIGECSEDEGESPYAEVMTTVPRQTAARANPHMPKITFLHVSVEYPKRLPKKPRGRRNNPHTKPGSTTDTYL